MFQQLEKIGFVNFYSRRIGPCDQCMENLQTYYLPEVKQWLCEHCFLSDSENTEFNNLMYYYLGENIMATVNLQELMARLEKLEAENVALKARGTDNIFVNTIDNLTLKHRSVAPSGWATPTKNQNGQGYLRCANFPMGYFISQDGTKLVLHTEIPVSPREVQIFKDRFLSQQIVVAKRRQTDGSSQTPASTPSYQSATPTPISSAPIASGGKSFASLTEDERKALVAEANSLLSTGLYQTLPQALESVLSAHKISK